MTLVVPSGYPSMNMQFVGVSGNWQAQVLDIAIQVGETLIRNYVNTQITNAKKNLQTQIVKGKNWNKARRNTTSQQWKWKRTNKTSNYRKFRWGKNRGRSRTTR